MVKEKVFIVGIRERENSQRRLEEFRAEREKRLNMSAVWTWPGVKAGAHLRERNIERGSAGNTETDRGEESRGAERKPEDILKIAGL